MEKSNFLYLHCGEQYLLQNFRLGLIELATVERDKLDKEKFSCRLYGLRKYKKQIGGDEIIAKGVQNGDSPD